MPRQIGFGARIEGANHVAGWTICATARRVREVVGEQYDGGWKEAFRDGWRVVRLEICW